jgi:hypothetical protein
MWPIVLINENPEPSLTHPEDMLRLKSRPVNAEEVETLKTEHRENRRAARAEMLRDPERLELANFIRQEANDLLSGHPSFVIWSDGFPLELDGFRHVRNLKLAKLANPAQQAEIDTNIRELIDCAATNMSNVQPLNPKDQNTIDVVVLDKLQRDYHTGLVDRSAAGKKKFNWIRARQTVLHELAHVAINRYFADTKKPKEQKKFQEESMAALFCILRIGQVLLKKGVDQSEVTKASQNLVQADIARQASTIEGDLDSHNPHFTLPVMAELAKDNFRLLNTMIAQAGFVNIPPLDLLMNTVIPFVENVISDIPKALADILFMRAPDKDFKVLMQNASQVLDKFEDENPAPTKTYDLGLYTFVRDAYKKVDPETLCGKSREYLEIINESLDALAEKRLDATSAALAFMVRARLAAAQVKEA